MPLLFFCCSERIYIIEHYPSLTDVHDLFFALSTLTTLEGEGNCVDSYGKRACRDPGSGFC